MGSRPGVNELAGDAHAARRLAHAARKDVAHAQLASDLLHVDRPSLVDKAGITGDDEQPTHARQCRDDVFHDAVSEILLFRFAAQVLEWQNGNRGLFGQGRRRRLRPFLISAHAIDSHRPLDVLHLVLAQKFQRHAELARQMIIGGAGDYDTAGMGEVLQPSCDVDSVAMHIVAIDDHIAEIDADPQVDPSPLGQAGVAFGHAALEGYCAFDRIDDADELGQQAVAHYLEDTVVSSADLRFEQFLAMRPQALEGIGLILFHEPTVPDHVCGKDCGEAALSAFFGHLTRLPLEEAGVRIVWALRERVYCAALPVWVTAEPKANRGSARTRAELRHRSALDEAGDRS
jgi:hypothetical protein